MATPTASIPSDLASISPAAFGAAYDESGFERRSDSELVGLCADVIDVPKAASPDSFVLHAPLELMARAQLLGRAGPTARELARRRLLWLAATYAAAGPAAEMTAPLEFRGRAAAVAHLRAAIAGGDLDGADGAVTWLRSTGPPLDLVSDLVDLVAPSLAGAAHGGIFLHQVLSYAGSGPVRAPGARLLARELARNPDWQLTWFRDEQRPAAGGPGHGGAALVESLRRPASPGALDSNFIFPTMSITESSGLAKAILPPALAPLDRTQASRALLRVAAWSMLQDDPGAAPYGWSHCLTMPHGLLSVAAASDRAAEIIDVAATYVLGFRATLAAVTIDPNWTPDIGPAADPLEQLAGSPQEAAAAVWHARAAEVPALTTHLVDYAAAHHDAHLAKYTLACLQQTQADPDAGRLYLAAGAHLGAWWRAQPPNQDPLA